MIAVLLADGFEEIEALTPVDMLRRAGLAVKTLSVSESLSVTGSHGITVMADDLAKNAPEEEIEALILPGGMPGTLGLDSSEYTNALLSRAVSENRVIGAICAAPLVLGRRGLLSGRRAVCYPGFEHELTGAIVTDSPVVTDGSIVTAKGMGAALPFSKELVRLLSGDNAEKKITDSIMEK